MKQARGISQGIEPHSNRVLRHTGRGAVRRLAAGKEISLSYLFSEVVFKVVFKCSATLLPHE
jgi:hypothetical protein